LYWLGGRLVKAYTKIMLRMSVISHFKIPGGPKIIVANHPTTSDPFILTSMSNGQASVIIKESLFDVPMFGKYLYWSGHIPVREGQGKTAFKEALNNLKEGITVIVFIEGTTSNFIHKTLKPKTGAVRLALSSNIPIIPIGISVRRKNIRSILSTIKGVKEWGKWYFKGPYALTIGKPIHLRGNTRNRIQVRRLSKWLAKKISILQNESAIRVKNLTYGN
jgi:1-acyl-sn-glycerol-3-phosphate acyltransferase